MMNTANSFTVLLNRIIRSFEYPNTDRTKFQTYLQRRNGACLQLHHVRITENDDVKFERVDATYLPHPKATSKIKLFANELKIKSQEIENGIRELAIPTDKIVSIYQNQDPKTKEILIVEAGDWMNLTDQEITFLYFVDRFHRIEQENYALLQRKITHVDEKIIPLQIQQMQRTLCSWSNQLSSWIVTEKATVENKKQDHYSKLALMQTT